MIINLNSIKNVQLINTEVVKGGKRYGAIKADSREGRRALRRMASQTDSNARAAAPEPGTMTHFINEKGVEICIEW